MGEIFRRTLRIQGEPGHKAGMMLTIRDHDTGEIINGIAGGTVHMNPNDVVTADIKYYQTDEEGHIIAPPPGENIQLHTATAQVGSIDVTALERCYQDLSHTAAVSVE